MFRWGCWGTLSTSSSVVVENAIEEPLPSSVNLSCCTIVFLLLFLLVLLSLLLLRHSVFLRIVTSHHKRGFVGETQIKTNESIDKLIFKTILKIQSRLSLIYTVKMDNLSMHQTQYSWMQLITSKRKVFIIWAISMNKWIPPNKRPKKRWKARTKTGTIRIRIWSTSNTLLSIFH